MLVLIRQRGEATEEAAAVAAAAAEVCRTLQPPAAEPSPEPGLNL